MSRLIFAKKCALSLASLPIKNSPGTRTMSIHSTKAFKKIKEMQVRMQCDDGVDVYLKKGTPDKVLFGITLFLLALGGIQAMGVVYRGAKRL